MENASCKVLLGLTLFLLFSLPLLQQLRPLRQVLFPPTLPSLRKLRRRRTDPAYSVTPNEKLLFVILLCTFRSGSTYLGQMFNENPEVLYDFESLHPYALLTNNTGTPAVTGFKPHHTIDSINLLYLQQIFSRCQFLVNSFEQYLHTYWR